MACLVVLAGLAIGQTSAASDPFAFFEPTVTVSADDRERLDRGDSVARIIPARGHSVAVFAAVPVDIPSERLEAWVRNIVAFKQSPQVLAIGRFSNPPVLEDLAPLTFPEKDLDELRHCKPGDCGLKLTRTEIVALSHALRRDPSPAAGQNALRRLVLRRVQTYLAQGQSALGAYDQNSTPLPIAAAFSKLLNDSPFLTQRLPEVAAVLEQWPHTSGWAVEPMQSFVYWSLEDYGGKPIVSATHVFVRRGNGSRAGPPETLVIGRQIFATHYIDAWLGVTALVRDAESGRAYLVYLNRTSLDILDGFWGGIVRRILQRRLKAEAPAVLNGIRRRLERGMPPAG